MRSVTSNFVRSYRRFCAQLRTKWYMTFRMFKTLHSYGQKKYITRECVRGCPPEL